MRTQWQVTHHPRILPQLDDRAGIKENVVLSLVVRLHFAQPGRLQASPLAQRLEKQTSSPERAGSLASYILPGNTSFLIAFLSGTHGVSSSPALEKQASITYPPFLAWLLHKPGFTQRALQSTRQPSRDILNRHCEWSALIQTFVRHPLLCTRIHPALQFCPANPLRYHALLVVHALAEAK